MRQGLPVNFKQLSLLKLKERKEYVVKAAEEYNSEILTNWKSSDSKDIAPNHSGGFLSSFRLLILCASTWLL